MSQLFSVSPTDAVLTPDAKTGWTIWRSTNVVYHVAHNASSGSAATSLRIYQSVDGGEIWDEGVTVPIGEGNPAAQVAAVWYDRWTPGDTGDLIHIAMIVLDGAVAVHPIYTNYDTTTGDFTSPVDISATTVGFTSLDEQAISITKTVGGNLLCSGWRDNSASHFTFRSTDGGAVWGSIATLPKNNAADFVRLLPGNEADTDDAYAIYWDRTAEALTLETYDDSLNSWSNVSIDASVNDRASEHVPLSATVRADGNVYVAYWCENATTAANDDLCVVEITDATTVTVRDRLVYDRADTQRSVSIVTEILTGDLYLYQPDFSTTTGILKRRSQDDGVTFTEFSRTADTTDVQTFSQDVAVTLLGGRFRPVASRLGTDLEWYLLDDEVVVAEDVTVQTDSLAQYFPPGLAFASVFCDGTVARGLLSGLAQEILRSENLLTEFRDNILPDETILLIDEWESALGIPDDCFTGSGTAEQRRTEVLVKLASLGVQTLADFQKLANLLGIGMRITTGADHDIYMTKTPVIGFSTDKIARNTIVVDFDDSLGAGFPYTFPFTFGNASLQQIQCLFNKLKPAHVDILYTNL